MTDDVVRQHTALAWKIAHRYYAGGHEREDLVQEALAGLVFADRDYRPELGAFRTFAALCMERQVQNAVKASLTGRHRVLTNAGRVGRDDDGDELPILDLVADPRADVPTLAGQRHTLAVLARTIGTLTPAERRAVVGLANGLTYAQIGGRKKQVDNAVQRARRKLREAA